MLSIHQLIMTKFSITTRNTLILTIHRYKQHWKSIILKVTNMGLPSGIVKLRESIKDNSRGLLSLLGCFVVHLSLGSFYSFGNLTTYMTSYMKNTTSPDITYGDFVIVPSGNSIRNFPIQRFYFSTSIIFYHAIDSIVLC